MIDYDIVERDFKRFCELNAKTYNKSPEFMSKTPTAKAYFNYLIDREKDKIREKEVKK